MGRKDEAIAVETNVKQSSSLVRKFAKKIANGETLTDKQKTEARGAAREFRDLASRFAALVGVESAGPVEVETDTENE